VLQMEHSRLQSGCDLVVLRNQDTTGHQVLHDDDNPSTQGERATTPSGPGRPCTSEVI
jgi:hypothetical protein